MWKLHACINDEKPFLILFSSFENGEEKASPRGNSPIQFVERRPTFGCHHLVHSAAEFVGSEKFRKAESAITMFWALNRDMEIR